MFTKKIHVFKAGDQTSAQGVQRHFSEKDLQQVVETYDPSIHEAPLVIGHAGDNDSLPAYGWIQGFSKQGGNLYADVAFTDTAKIEKWFKRNCKDVLERECSAAEKADVLSYLMGVKP